jgi:hypothetical protein
MQVEEVKEVMSESSPSYMVPPGILLHENGRRMSKNWRKHK